MRETKQILNTAGSIHIRMEIWNNEFNHFEYVGDCSSVSVSKNYSSMLRKAIKDGISQFYYKNKNIQDGFLDVYQINFSSLNIKYRILQIRYTYFYDFISIKRISKNGKYYNEVREKPKGKSKKGKLISRSKWKNKRFEETTEEDYYFE